jgi:FkbM family methyltransferase
MNMDMSKLDLPENPVIIDCGCNEGQWLDVVLPQLKGKPRVIAIDMLPEELAVCQARHPEVHTLRAALCNYTDYWEDAYRHQCSQSSSLLEMTALHDLYWGSPTHVPIQTFSVNETQLDMIAALLQLKHVDLLKLDLQGTELEALEGGEDVLENTTYVLSEISWPELYRGQCSFDQVDEYLREKGFEGLLMMDAHYSPLYFSGHLPVSADLVWRKVKEPK